jgi:hypothetical protein
MNGGARPPLPRLLRETAVGGTASVLFLIPSRAPRLFELPESVE